MGFIFNGKASDGVDKFCSSVDDIKDDINDAFKMVTNLLCDYEWVITRGLPRFSFAVMLNNRLPC